MEVPPLLGHAAVSALLVGEAGDRVACALCLAASNSKGRQERQQRRAKAVEGKQGYGRCL